jgi:hypothetical protein
MLRTQLEEYYKDTKFFLSQELLSGDFDFANSCIDTGKLWLTN